MPANDGQTGCFIRRKHRERGPLIPGGPVAEDDLVRVSGATLHALRRPAVLAYLGYLSAA
jgi:hypothetical protein